MYFRKDGPGRPLYRGEHWTEKYKRAQQVKMEERGREWGRALHAEHWAGRSPKGETSLAPSKGACVPCARVNEKVLNYNKQTP